MTEVAYVAEIRRLLNCVETSQASAIAAAADLIADALATEHMWHVFGTGHGHMLAEEVFYRAGGMMAVNAVLDSPLMLHDGALASSQVERLPGYAAIVLSKHNLEADDVLLIASNSGRNAVPIEAALEARERGLKVIALTSVAHSQAVTSRHPSGKKLYELADVVLNNCGQPGDAILEVEGLAGRLCATSTVIGATLLHWLVYEVVQRLLERGVSPDVTISANVPGGDVHNEAGFTRYRDRIRSL
jgi:uncharacterized phosphosugar-binding protein